MEDGMKEVGARIRDTRKNAGLSQADLAEKLNISLSHMSDIETGKSNFGVDILMRITEVLQVSADYLLRTNIPEVNAIYSAEVENIISKCSNAEREAILQTVKNMKTAFNTNKQ